MTLQTLHEQLLELRLPAFRQALQEQQSNSKYTKLAFEERLALLVDTECTQRRENRIRRNIHTAAFSISASLEDLDISTTRFGTAFHSRAGTMQLDYRSTKYDRSRSNRFRKIFFSLRIWHGRRA